MKSKTIIRNPKVYILLGLMMSMVISGLHANTLQQRKEITGIITDMNNEPLIGASVVEKSTNTGTITDFEGKFTLSVPEKSTITVSYIGYITKEISTDGKGFFNILLNEDANILDEIVVVGYGTMKKKDLTGAVGTVEGNLLQERSTAQLSTALQGAIGEVMVTRNNSAPGATATIRVRGITTMGENDPLVIVDGVPGSIDHVNASDVENISVLKDAASASIYGSRAAAGVILITTKRARKDQLSIRYNGEYGFEWATATPKTTGAVLYMQMTNEKQWNDNGNKEGNEYSVYNQDLINNYDELHAQNPNLYPDTNWKKLMMNSTAPRQSHVVTLSGGTQKVKSNASISYSHTDALASDRYYERIMARLNNDFTFNKYWGATVDFNISRSKTGKEPLRNPFNFESGLFKMPAIYPAVWEDGRIAEGKAGRNDYASTKYGGSKDSYYTRIAGKFAIDFTPFDGFKVSFTAAPTLVFDKIKSFRKELVYYTADDPTVIGGKIDGHTTSKLEEARNDTKSLTTQVIATYIKDYKDHSFNVMAGYEGYTYTREELKASRDKYSLENFPYLDLGPLDLRDNSGSAYENAYMSYFGRVVYSWKNRYLLQGNIRYDGSSRFHKDHRWGCFPSFSGGWVMSEENFMQNAGIKWLSFLKLRASWGTLGNERIGNYPYQSTIAFGNALFYQNGEVIAGQTAYQSSYAIQNITWEKTTSTDFGIDANLFNNRLRMSADYYVKRTEDMLLALEIPRFIGLENPDQNAGKMKTKGWGFDLSWNDKAGEVSYEIKFNLSDFKSTMGNLNGKMVIDGGKIKMEGSQFNEWYGYVSDGIYQNWDDVNNSAKLNNNVSPGDIKYKDISGPDGVPDGKISPEYDRVLLGGSLPRYMFGGSFQLEYKNIDFSMSFQGVGKQKVSMSRNMVEPLVNNWSGIPQIYADSYWSMYNTEEQNLRAKYPRLTFANSEANYTTSDYWLFNGRYLRLKNITAGYTFPKVLVEKIRINNLRIYASLNDLFQLSKYPKGWDPESGGTMTYPITSSALLGVSINF